MTRSPSTAGTQTIEALAAHVTEATISLIGSSQELAFRQSDRTRSLQSELSEKAAQLGDAMVDTLAGIGRANLDIALTFNQLAVIGAGVCWRESFRFNQALLDKGLATGLRMLETRSAEELIAAQTDYLKDSVDQTLAESAKIYELVVKVADAALAPLGARTANTVTPFARTKAA